MNALHFIALFAFLTPCLGQRSPYAGRRPIGLPVIETTTSALGNRFGDNSTNITTTTQRLPIEALGDRDLVNRLGQLPQDKQPFWYLNWQALESHRSEPHTFALRPNIFNSPITPQNIPTNNVPQQNFANNPVPQQNFANGGVPQQNFANGAVPQQNFASNGFPQQNFASNGVPQQNFVNSAFPQQNFANSAFPQQNFPNNNIPLINNQLPIGNAQQ